MLYDIPILGYGTIGGNLMKQAKDHIIFPLDVPSLDAAIPFVQRLAGQVGMFKVGLELFISAGPEIIRLIREQGAADIFLDLKLHDIPATVNRAMESIAGLKVTFATVHCGESKKMLEAAVQGSKGRVGVLGVTVLTSINGQDLRETGFQEEFASDITKLVLKKAAMARDAGCTGIVCSGQEAKLVKKAFGPDLVAVTPGIRPSWEHVGSDDQQRVMTPARAIRDGADYLVIGRPIRDAGDPAAAAARIAEEIESAL
jgi:orotidine-5'-phosphate decarboxylase